MIRMRERRYRRLPQSALASRSADHAEMRDGIDTGALPANGGVRCRLRRPFALFPDDGKKTAAAGSVYE
jgi:hypothetical protein